MKLTTDRLNLSPLSEKDRTIFHHTNVDPFVRKFLWDDEIIPESLSSQIIDEVISKFKTENWGLWKMTEKQTGEYVGYVGFWFFFDEKLPQLLFALLPEYTGKGYATEASKCVTGYAFTSLGFDYVIASMDKSNQNSSAVCKRMAMEFAGEREIDGKPILFYKMLNQISTLT